MLRRYRCLCYKYWILTKMLEGKHHKHLWKNMTLNMIFILNVSISKKKKKRETLNLVSLIFFLFKYSWFKIFCYFQVYSVMIQYFNRSYSIIGNGQWVYFLCYIVYPFTHLFYISLQFSSVAQSCPTICDPMDCSTPGFLVHYQFSNIG